MELHNSNHDSSTEKSQTKPFRFFDLPVELRYMVYKRLMNKKVYFQFPRLQGFDHVMFGARFDICFRPGMLRVCKQFKDEYRYLALSKMPLVIKLLVHDGYLSFRYDCGRFFVPDVVLDEIRNVHLIFHLTDPMQFHGELQQSRSASSNILTNNSSLDHLHLAEKIVHKLPKLHKMTFIECISLHTLDKAVSKNPQTYREYGRKLEKAKEFLSSITKEMEIQDAKTHFVLHHPLYQPWNVALDALHPLKSSSNPSTAHSNIPHVLFAASDIPDEDTFELHGLHLKFMQQTSKSLYQG